MFSNLQNKIDLRNIKEGKVTIDKEFAFKEDFDVVNQVIGYFEKEMNAVNNIVIKEEVAEYENEELFEYLETNVADEQEYIYNDDAMIDDIKDNVESDEEEVFDEAFKIIEENYAIWHKEQKPMSALLEYANNEMKQVLDQYRMIDGDEESLAGEYDVEALFDKEVLDMARKEQLNQIYSVDWLSKRLVDYRKVMKDDLASGGKFQVVNNLKSLDINDPSEILNKIKDLNESVKFLKSRLV